MQLSLCKILICSISVTRPGKHLVQVIIPKPYLKKKCVADSGPVESSFAARPAVSCRSPQLQGVQFRALHKKFIIGMG